MVEDPATADAIVEDAISQAIQRAERDQPRNFFAWLFQIAKNSARHWLRRKKIEQKFLDRYPHVLTARSAGEEVLGREAVTLFKEVVDQLTDAQRRALLYHLIDRLPYEEIGKLMGIQPGAARALVHRGRKRLSAWRDYMRA